MTEDPLQKKEAGLIASQGKGLMIAVLGMCGILIIAIIIFVSILAAQHSGDLRRFVAKLMTPPQRSEPVTEAVSPVHSVPPAPRPAIAPYPVPPIPAVPLGNMGDWFPPDSYPIEARRREDEGRVTVRLNIDPTGTPRQCDVLASSGSIWLDDATCTLALRHGRFAPARDAEEQPVWSTFTLRSVKWQIQDR